MYYEILTTERSRRDPRRAFRRFPSVRRTGQALYRIQADERKERKIARICRRRHYILKRKYPEQLGRSDNYRRAFLAQYPRPAGGYRCRYCHRRIPNAKLTIDHIFPVYMAKTGRTFPMRLLGIEDVNDVRNLAPACRRCNYRKGSRAGLWIVRAALGKYRVYWILLRLAQLLLLGVLIWLVVSSSTILAEWVWEIRQWSGFA